jgi:hypothetical protein
MTCFHTARPGSVISTGVAVKESEQVRRRCTEKRPPVGWLLPGLVMLFHPIIRAEEPPVDTAHYSEFDLSGDHSIPEPVVIDRVVAVVNDRVLTARDLRIESAIAELQPGPFPLIWIHSPDPLQALIDQALVRHRAGDVTIYQPSSSEVRARLSQLRDSWDDPRQYSRFLIAHQLDEATIESILYSRLVAENFVHRQVVLTARGQTAEQDEAALVQRYAEWIEEVREEGSVRAVAPMEWTP